MAHPGQPLSGRGEGAAGQVLNELNPWSSRTCASPLSRRSPRRRSRVERREQNALGYVGVPLVSRGRTIGVLSLVTTKHRDFSAGEIAFLQAICGAAAVSIDNALIHRDIQRRAESWLAR